MALVAHRMMLPARHRRTTQQVARNKVGVLLVPSVADYYGGDVVPPTATPLPTPAVSQLNLQPDPPEPAVDGSGGGKFLAGNQPTCLEFSGILRKAMLSGTDFVTGAYVEIGNGSQVRRTTVDSVRANTTGGQVNEIIKQAAKEYEMAKLQRFLGRREKISSVYSIGHVAAYEEVDGRQQDPSLHLTPEQRCECEMKSIILLAQKEHEDRIRHQVIATMKQRADQELVKRRDINPFPHNLIREPMVDDEEVRALLDLVASSENNSENDDDNEAF